VAGVADDRDDHFSVFTFICEHILESVSHVEEGFAVADPALDQSGAHPCPVKAFVAADKSCLAVFVCPGDYFSPNKVKSSVKNVTVKFNCCLLLSAVLVVHKLSVVFIVLSWDE